MTRFIDTFLRAVGVAALVAMALPTVVPAQYNPRVNDRVLGPGGGLPQGITRDGNIWSFDTAAGTPAGMYFGILFPPMAEPLEPKHSGRGYIVCTGPTGFKKCQLKVNIAGNGLTFGEAIWRLSGGTAQ